MGALAVGLLCGPAGCTSAAGDSDGSSGSQTGASTETSTETSTGAPTGSGESSESGGEDMKVCAEQHDEMIDGQAVVVCDLAFADPPFVHVPPAQTLPGGRFEAHFALQGAGFTDGVETHAFAGTPAEREAEALRHAFVIYRVVADEVGNVESYTPAVYIDERNFLKPVVGLGMQGLISRKTGDTYELDPTLNVQVSFGLPELVDDSVPGMARYAIPVSVDNLKGGIMGEDGVCMPALESFGAENPFTSYPSALVFARVPSMHDIFDDVATIAYTESASVMAESLYLDPLDMIQAEAPVLGEYQGYGHGTPGSIPNLFVHVIDAVAGPCAP